VSFYAFKFYKDFCQVAAAIASISTIAEGEFFTHASAPAVAQTTTLRMNRWLEKPDSGEIHLGEQCLVAPEKGLFIKPEKRQHGHGGFSPMPCGRI